MGLINLIRKRRELPRTPTLAILFKSILPVISLLAISILVYGVFIARLGFYHDDWPLVWVYHSMGLEGLAKWFKGNRPFAGWIYSLIFPYLGVSPIGWHALALSLRWLSSVFLFFTFRLIWPKKLEPAWLISVFALLYPGFSLQPLSVTYVPQHLSFLLFSISLAVTVWSIRSSKIYWTIISLVIALTGYLIIEYFVGLELLRPVIIFLALSSTTSQGGLSGRIKQVLSKWSPFVIIFLIYSIWRLFLFHSSIPYQDGISQLSTMMQNPYSEIISRFIEGIRNILMASVMAWSRTINSELLSNDWKPVLFSCVIGMFVVVITILTLKITKTSYDKSGNDKLTDPENNSAQAVFLLGFFALIVGGLPIVYSGLRIEYDLQNFLDRYTLPYLLGSALVLAGILLTLKSNGVHKTIFLSIIIFLFSSFQIRNENTFRRDWQDQKSFFWQLKWRLPNLKQGTGVYVDQIPFSLQHNHGSELVDLLYNVDNSDGKLRYFVFDLEWLAQTHERSFKSGTIFVPSFKSGEPAVGSLRSFVFRGNTSQSVVLWRSSSGTLRIIDGRYVDQITRLRPYCRSIAHLSNVQEAVNKNEGSPDSPLFQIFGPEPSHEWSYFYQKAELERQFGSWDKVAQLGDEARGMGYEPWDLSEWFPFIEGYAMTGKYELAVKLSEQLLDASPDGLEALSNLWNRVALSKIAGSEDLKKALDSLRGKLMLSEQYSISK
jgi:hypothetical protein